MTQKIYISCSDKTKEENAEFISEVEEKYNLKDVGDLNSESSAYIIVIGGDGSLNYLVNNVKLNKDHQVVYFPDGTANDFAKSLKLPVKKPTLKKLDSILKHAVSVSIPVMQCNVKKFINVADLPPNFAHINIGTIIPTKGVKLWEWFATMKNRLSPSLEKLS